MYAQLGMFFDNHGFLSEAQFGFIRKGRSTVGAVQHIVENFC